MIDHCRFTLLFLLAAAWAIPSSAIAAGPAPSPQQPDQNRKPESNESARAVSGDTHPIESVLQLSPSEGNPRNSEGDFIALADGRLLFVYTHFTGGSSDHAAAKLASRVSKDRGATWSAEDRVVLENEADWNVMSVSLLRLDDGRIALFYMRKNSLDDCRPYVRFSSDEAETWSEPVEIIGQDQVGYYVLNNDRVIQLDDGRLIVPVALHNRPGWQQPDWRGQITCYLSDDSGRSWRRSKTQQTAEDHAGNRITAQEPGVIELDDGRVMLWVRTDAGQQYRAYSSDRGESWSEFEPMPLASPRSPASIERIPETGDLLAVWNDHAHRVPAERKARTPLSIAVSRDEGKTWTRAKDLADDPQGWYCYTAIEFVDQHVLLGHVAGKQADQRRLATSNITRFPLAWYYRTLGDQQVIEQLASAGDSKEPEPKDQPVLIETQKIWDQAPHNAFTDLVRFHDQWFCVFREGSGHVSPDGALRVIVSNDGKKWKSAARITSDRADLRDAKLSVTPGGKLMLSGAGALHDRSEYTHQSFSWFSSDGFQWGEPHEVGDKNFWLWRVTWHDDTAYGLGYRTGDSSDRSVRLYRSDDGKQFETVVENLFDTGYPNESSLVFLDDGTCYCLLRRDHGTKTAQLGIAQPPYRDWTWKDLGVRIGGPDMIRLPSGRLVAAVRLYDGGARTSLCWVDPSSGSLQEFLELPSGGDTSYAGLVWHQDRLWVSYYSSHNGKDSNAKSSIYLAKVAFGTAGDATDTTANPHATTGLAIDPAQLQQRWRWDRGEPADRVWEDGVLKIKTQAGRIWAGEGNRNLLVAKQTIDDSDGALADIELVDAVGKWEQCGLLVYVDDDHFVKLVVEHIDGDHYVVMAWERSQQRRVIAKQKITGSRAQLRLRVAGDQVRGFWRITKDDPWKTAASCEFAFDQLRRFALFSQDGDPDRPRRATVHALSYGTNADDHDTETNSKNPSDGDASDMNSQSSMLQPWTGPYGGVPPFHLVRPEEFPGAFDTAIQRATEEIEAIAENPEPPTFTNTFVALERAGRELDRLDALFGVHQSNLNVGPIPDIERAVVPKLAAFQDSVTQNPKLFARIEAVFQSDQRDQLSPAENRLIEERYKTFVREGAKLNQTDKAKLSQINTRLARLFTEFSQNVLADEQAYVTWIDDPKDLAGLPESVVASMAAAAKERNNENGRWAVINTRSSMDPFLTYADNRRLREQVWRNYYSRGDNGGPHDNNAIIKEILRLRASRAALLGYESHAHWRMEPTMAKTPQAAMDLMMKVWPKAVERVRQEVSDMQEIADAENAGITIEPWDYRYYAEKVRKKKYDLDFNEVKPYLQLEKLREAMMWAAGELYGLQFERVSGLPVFHPDVRVWQVTDAKGDHAGLWYLDPYAREGKRSGAWMNAYRLQENIDEFVPPIVSNNSNFVEAAEGEVVLISWDDARTLFHEFGHALHGLLSDVQYPSQSGTSVPRDYVEFPSQLNEHWLETPAILNRFAVHHQTGEPMPQELIDKIERASTFNEGFATVEYLASALIDMKVHLAGDVEIDPKTFERETLAELEMPDEIVMRHRMPHFMHIFSSDSYSAGYYSYLWSDALTADAAEVFEEAGSYYASEVAESLLENVLSVGDTIDPADGFEAFRGRPVDTRALLRKRGFPVE